MIRCLSLFSGIGGLDMGLESTGRFQIVAQSEIDPYACRVLKKHWPDVPNVGDITELTEERLEGIGPVDLVCGGFPCQDLSVAGKGEGIQGSRSGLFYEMARVVSIVRPRYWIMENVPRLLAGGGGEWFGEVLRVVAESGLFQHIDWDCVPACAVRAPHRRDRVFVICRADTLGNELREQPRGRGRKGGAGAPLAGLNGTSRPAGEGGGWPRPTGDWQAEPDVGRVAHGVPNRVDRLRGLGNAVVPQVAAYVGQRVLEIEDARTEKANGRARPGITRPA